LNYPWHGARGLVFPATKRKHKMHKHKMHKHERQMQGLTGLKPKRPVMCVLSTGKPEIVPSGGSGDQSRVLRQVKRWGRPPRPGGCRSGALWALRVTW